MGPGPLRPGLWVAWNGQLRLRRRSRLAVWVRALRSAWVVWALVVVLRAGPVVGRVNAVAVSSCRISSVTTAVFSSASPKVWFKAKASFVGLVHPGLPSEHPKVSIRGVPGATPEGCPPPFRSTPRTHTTGRRRLRVCSPALRSYASANDRLDCSRVLGDGLLAVGGPV